MILCLVWDMFPLLIVILSTLPPANLSCHPPYPLSNPTFFLPPPLEIGWDIYSSRNRTLRARSEQLRFNSILTTDKTKRFVRSRSVPLHPFVVRYVFSAFFTSLCFLVHDFFQITKNYSLLLMTKKSKKVPQPLIQVTLKPPPKMHEQSPIPYKVW